MVTLLKEESLGELTWKMIPFSVSVLLKAVLSSACKEVVSKSARVERTRGLKYDMVDPFFVTIIAR
jgi:hypothetical protein